MSKVIKLNQRHIEKIVKNVISEHVGEYQPTMADGQIDEEVVDENVEKYGIAVGDDGRHYVMNIKTGEILGVK